MQGQKASVSGNVKLYEGRAEIVVTKREQLAR